MHIVRRHHLKCTMLCPIHGALQITTQIASNNWATHRGIFSLFLILVLPTFIIHRKHISKHSAKCNEIQCNCMCVYAEFNNALLNAITNSTVHV